MRIWNYMIGLGNQWSICHKNQSKKRTKDFQVDLTYVFIEK